MLKELLKDIPVLRMTGPDNPKVDSLTFDSRKAGKGSLFIAVKGEKTDGHDFIPQAVANGACAVLCEEIPESTDSGVTYIQVKDSHRETGMLAANFYGHPSDKLKLAGVTGTNGKTTVATLLYDLHRRLGYQCGLISTGVYKIEDQEIASTHTTPDAIRINELLSQMVDQGCEYCFMEVSSHSVVQQRIYGLTFAGGIFTNLTHDHLDYHGTFRDYIEAKKGFFDALPRGAFALVNSDDKNGSVMVQNTRATVKTYSLKSFSDFRCRIVEKHFEGMLLNIDGEEVWVKFIGGFNAYNLLAVYATSVLLGNDKRETVTALSELEPVAGRFQYLISPSGVVAIVDYAHTPDALQNVLDSIREIKSADSKIYTVVGCGGDRDKTKRPLMARIAVDHSDMAVLTSDNPRFEDPQVILKDMTEGLGEEEPVLVISDRSQAIRTAVALARRGDIVLVAGKGHENYQSVRGVNHPFDDREELMKCFKMNS